jgi:putative transcriptional regulator
MEKKLVFLKKLGLHIQKIRMRKGLSQSELANIIGKDRQSIQRLEAGKINPSIYYLTEIAEGLEVNPKEFLNF